VQHKEENTSDELTIFATARAAGEGLRRTFDTYMSIAAAVRIARNHADAPPGGTKKVRGSRFRKILDEQGLGHIATNDASQLLKVQSKLPEIRKWRAGLTDVQRIRWSSPQSVLNRAPCFRPDGKIRGPAPRARPMTLNEFLRQPASDAALLLHRRCAPKFFALLREMTELANAGAVTKPVSGWAADRKRAAAGASAGAA
jgi:hypothetical protein